MDSPRIIVVPIGNIPGKVVEELKNSMHDFCFDITFKDHIEMPNCYSQFRRQYSSDKLLEQMKPETKDVYIYITKEDIYDRDSGFLFHKAQIDGPSVFSYFRLRPSFYREKINFDLLLERMKKELIFTVGYSLGLGECKPPCIMARSSSVKNIDEKGTEFCNKCKTKLSLMGIDI